MDRSKSKPRCGGGGFVTFYRDDDGLRLLGTFLGSGTISKVRTLPTDLQQGKGNGLNGGAV